jgi:hypothetical protein
LSWKRSCSERKREREIERERKRNEVAFSRRGGIFRSKRYSKESRKSLFFSGERSFSSVKERMRAREKEREREKRSYVLVW